MHGILLMDKPSGWTSFDVVNKVRYLIENAGLDEVASGNDGEVKKKRFPVGHTGTLDPLATGLLVLLLGDYTKRATELVKAEKTYEAEMMLGHVSSTGDEEGIKTFITDRQPTPEEIEHIFEEFTGEIKQTPPAFSAIKVNGERAYKLARQGKEVNLEPRLATIHELTLEEYKYPTVKFNTHVSSGTYIRTLIEDMGGELGVGAYMTSLRRTVVGAYKVENALHIENLNSKKIQEAAFTLD